jgi:hypothetical protein
MGIPGKPGYKEAWSILTEVDAALADEKDATGQVKNTGEGRALNYMQRKLQNEIAKDGSAFLRRHGFNGSGSKRAKRGRR